MDRRRGQKKAASEPHFLESFIVPVEQTSSNIFLAQVRALSPTLTEDLLRFSQIENRGSVQGGFQLLERLVRQHQTVMS
jgi:hypothetical protein